MDWSDLCAQLVSYAELGLLLTVCSEIHARVQPVRQLHREGERVHAWHWHLPHEGLQGVLDRRDVLVAIVRLPIVRIARSPPLASSPHTSSAPPPVPLPKLGLLVSIQPNRQVLRCETGLIEVKVHPTSYNLASLEGDLIALQLSSNPVSYTHLTLPTICSV